MYVGDTSRLPAAGTDFALLLLGIVIFCTVVLYIVKRRIYDRIL